jgi:hypothetical protein
MITTMRLTTFFAVCTATIVCIVLAPSLVSADLHPSTTSYLEFSGDGAYVEIPSAPDLSFGPDGFTVSAWLKPDTLQFPHQEGSGYVYWMGKGEPSQYEWATRMYSFTNSEQPPRPNRISFYLFNPSGGLGQGSYSQEPIQAGQWIQITAWANRGDTAIYKNGKYVRCDEYDGPAGHGCQAHPERIVPKPGKAPLRLATLDLKSFFEGGLAEVRIWNRALANDEVQKVFEGDIPRSGLVAEFLLNEGKGDIVHDTTRRHEGKIVGARWATLTEKFPPAPVRHNAQ